MLRQKIALRLLASASVVLVIHLRTNASPQPSLPPASVPVITNAQRTYLTRLVRRTVRDVILGREPYEPTYVPTALRTMKLEVVVRLRQRGYLRAAGSAGPAPIALASRDAATTAIEMIQADRAVDLDLVNRLLVEIEVVGPPQAIPIEGNWTDPRVISPYIEPGIHGVIVAAKRRPVRYCPTETFTSDTTVAVGLRELAKQTGLRSMQIAKTPLMRFRTVHWCQERPSAKIVSLQRGLTLILPEAVSVLGLDDAIDALADYALYRQLPSGLFTHAYAPATDRYLDDDNLIRQLWATAAMTQYARWSGRSATIAAADLSIAHHLQGLAGSPGFETEAAYIATADGRNKLGVTALLCIALEQYPNPSTHAQTRRRLVNGMLRLQHDSGMFATAFPPARDFGAQDYYPGEALLAMAMQYEHEPDGRLLDAFDRAHGYYREHFRMRRVPAFVPWQVQAFTRMAILTKRDDYADFVFELTDWLASMQLDETNCAWSDMHGGIATFAPGRAGFATASYLEAFADALRLAQHRQDAARITRYETVVRRAARFVMQLQVRPEEAYFIRSPIDAIGGIRSTPSLNLLPIDHTMHALVALTKTRDVLFGERR